MKDRRVDLTDPFAEPSREDFDRLTRAAGDSVRAESALLAARRRREAYARHSGRCEKPSDEEG